MQLLIGWILDIIYGDPARLPHPIVWFGKWIAMGEHHLNKGTHRKAKGAIFTVLTITVLFALTHLLQILTSPSSPLEGGWGNFSLAPSLWGRVVAEAIFIFFCLAGHTLRKEVQMVFEAVDRSVEEGRRQVARIVGRDTSQLDAQEIRTAALETLAENLSDGVIAPLFWYALLGLPGMLTYKMINTFDSMIGYQNQRYKDFGCWAAHIDDIANYIPARLTALLMIIAAPMRKPLLTFHISLLTFVRKFGRAHASPNSGYPEAALAGILNCRFGGPHNYFGEYFYKPFIGTNPRPLTTGDMKMSIRICLIAECIAVVAVAVV